MEKFIILNSGSEKFYISADAVATTLIGTTPNIYIAVSYSDKLVTLQQTAGDFVQADVDLLNSKIAEVWAQGNTEATIGPVALSQAVSDIA